MKKRKSGIAFGFLTAFLLWTAAVKWIDVQAIGPEGSAVGFATLNGFIHNRIDVHMGLYILTDWLSVIPLGLVAGFGLQGLIQWIRRKSLGKVDRDLLILGGFYAAVMAMFLLFEVVVINYRPVLIEGVLEVAYPSSTTMLCMCVLPTAALRLRSRKWLAVVLMAFTIFMVAARLISGVHWLTDIIGGALLSAGLVMLYDSLI